MTKTLAYYPGCSLHGTSGEFDASFKATARALDLVLQEIPGWECCGNTAAHSINRLLSVALPVNELAKVEQDMKLDAVAVPCAACYSRFKTGAHEVAESEQTAADVRAVVGRAYNGGVAVDNLIDVYHDAVGLEELDAKVTRPFAGLKVACYYGCLLTRPPKVTLADDPEYPTHMDEVVEALGCEPVDWNYKTDCCGASLALTEQGIVDDLVGRILTDAKACGARGRDRRLPALPGEPGRPAGRDRQEGRRLAGHPRGVPQPARRPRARPGRQDARPQEAPRGHHGGDGVAHRTAVRPATPARHPRRRNEEGRRSRGAPLRVRDRP